MAIKPAKPVDQTDAKGHAAGTIFVGPAGDILLLHRSSKEKNYAGHWCLPGGGVDEGESPEDGATREAAEELGGQAPMSRKRLLDQRITPNGLVFHTFAQACASNFVPLLNEEHSGYTWAKVDLLPGPLHPSVKKTLTQRGVTSGRLLANWAERDDAPEDHLEIDECGTCGGTGEVAGPGVTCEECGGTGVVVQIAMDAAFEALLAEVQAQTAPALAFDRAPEGLLDRHGIVATLAFDRDLNEGRSTDGFERLHVKRAPITKAGINPYYGREIPKGRELGLHPDKVYKLLRHPEEIQKGAATSHNVPLLSEHVPHSADDHDGDITVGTVGSDSEYEHPFLYNSLAVWSRDGIDHVEKKTKKELSSAYGYDADMTPGTYGGEAYDGVMRNMAWNHVCLVKKGRAGSDVALDEELKPQQETTTMKLKSMKATVAYGALTTFLKPKIAMDAAMPNIGAALETFQPGKFKESIPNFIAALRKSLGKIKLAQDADLAGVVDGVQKLMASIDGDKVVKDEKMERDPNEQDQDSDPDGDDVSMDDDGMAAVKAYLAEKGVPEDIIAGMPGGEKKVDPGMTSEDEFPAGGKNDGEEGDDDGKKKNKPFDKGAMDAAIAKAQNDTIKRMNGINDAKEKVRPVVGALTMAFDSAEGVYRHAFKMQGKDVAKVKELSSLEAMWDMLPKPGEKPQRETIAQDGAATDYASRFPNAAKVKRA